MFELPFCAGSFDVVVSFNGTWARCRVGMTVVTSTTEPEGV
jgi:hypothetical protein